jgi:hypothetical protein
MALMPGYDTRSAADVAHQVAQERLQQQAQEIQQEQFAAGMQQRDRELALQAFQAQQNAQLRAAEQARLREAHAQEVAFRALRNAVDLGVKFDPASKTWRPLTEEDAEYTPWKETQAERKLKLPLTPDQQVELARRKTIAVGEAQEPFLVRAGKREAERTQKERVAKFQQRMTELKGVWGQQNKRDVAAAKESMNRLKFVQENMNARHKAELATKKLIEQERAKAKAGTAEEKAAAAKAKLEASEEKARYTRFQKSTAMAQSAHAALMSAMKARDKAATQEWEKFQKETSWTHWEWGKPEESDIAEEGWFKTQWDIRMERWNREVREAQARYDEARKLVAKTGQEYAVGGSQAKPEPGTIIAKPSAGGGVTVEQAEEPPPGTPLMTHQETNDWAERLARQGKSNAEIAAKLNAVYVKSQNRFFQIRPEKRAEVTKVMNRVRGWIRDAQRKLAQEEEVLRKYPNNSPDARNKARAELMRVLQMQNADFLLKNYFDWFVIPEAEEEVLPSGPSPMLIRPMG